MSAKQSLREFGRASREALNADRQALTHDLRASLLTTVLQQHPVALSASAICAAVVVGVLWSVAPHVWLLSWLGLVCGVTVVRYLVMRHYQKRPPRPERTTEWARMFTTGAAASGVLWGAAGLLFFVPGIAVYQVFLSFVIGGLCAGAAVGSHGICPL